MLRVAVVEDNDTDKKIIMESLGRFALEENEHLNISEFHDAMDFPGAAENRFSDRIYGYSDAIYGWA